MQYQMYCHCAHCPASMPGSQVKSVICAQQHLRDPTEVPVSGCLRSLWILHHNPSVPNFSSRNEAHYDY